MSTPLPTTSEQAIPHQPRASIDREALARRIGELGEWFHNLDLLGVSTAPNHFLGDFPNVK